MDTRILMILTEKNTFGFLSTAVGFGLFGFLLWTNHQASQVDNTFAAQDHISLLPKLAIHHCLSSSASMRDVQKVSLLQTHLHSVHLNWWKRQV